MRAQFDTVRMKYSDSAIRTEQRPQWRDLDSLSSAATIPAMPVEISDAVSTSLWQHVATVGGFLLAVFAIARLMSEKRQPGNTMAWLLVIVLIPYLGVPLFLLLGGRKLRRVAARKSRLMPHHARSAPGQRVLPTSPTVQTILAAGGTEPTADNQVQLITTGEQAFEEIESLIRTARYSIDIAAFILGRDSTGKKLVQLLAQRARQGIKVRLLLDGLGCLVSSRHFVDPIRKAGGEVARFLPVLPFSPRHSANLRNHRKIMIFDGEIAVVGGHNLAREYLGPGPWRKRWADFGAIIRGSAVTALHEVFLADWAFARGLATVPPATKAPALDAPDLARTSSSALQVVASGPDVAGDPLYEGILSMIQEAKRSIWIVTPYFIPDEVLLRSLIVKVRAGCEVTLIVPAKSNHPVTDFARRHYVRQLQEAGARVMLYQPGMLHSKAIIVDHAIGLLGSANFDLRSLFLNFEIVVVLYSEADVLAMRRWATGLLRDSLPHQPAPPRRFRFLGDIAEDLSRLLAPML